MKHGKVDRKALLRATAAVLAPLLASPRLTSAVVLTDNYTYSTSGTDDWLNTTHWSTGAVPAAGYTVGVTAAQAGAIVTFDGNYTAALYSLTIDGGSGGVELSQATSGDNLYSSSEIIGNSGIGQYLQSLSTNTVSGTLTLGSASTSTGIYTLSGGTLSAGSEIIANAATGSSGNPGGSVVQSGGTNTASGTLTLANAAGSVGAYSLSGTGVLTVGSTADTTLSPGGVAYIGNYGAGTLNQSGGTTSFAGVDANGNSVYVGYGGGPQTSIIPGSQGVYNLSGGAFSTAGNLVLGAGSHGTFVQSGGTAAVSGVLDLGGYQAGYYSLSSFGVLTAGSEVVGAYGTGTFSQSGGTNTCIGSASVTEGGSYVLSGGSFSAASFTVGGYTGGNATQSGGTATFTGVLDVGPGDYTGGGSYSLSKGSLSAGSEIVGDVTGQGTFNQSGGTNVDNGSLTIATNYDDGVYSLGGGGVLTVTGAEYIGYANGAAGSFTQSSGTHTSNNQLYLGYSATTTGVYALSNGTLNSRQVSIGYNGSGTFTQSGGTHAITNFLNIGDQSGSSGIYQMSSGTVSGTPDINVGAGGNGSFIQSGGTVNFLQLQMGVDSAAAGTYSLSSGSLLAGGSGYYPGYEQIGESGSATFNQSSGTHTAGLVYLAYGSGGSGTYLLSGGSYSSAQISMGYGGAALFNQSGGTQSISGALDVGVSGNSSTFAGGSALFTLSNGALSAGSEAVGLGYETYTTPGTFIQSGGTNTTSSLTIGSTGPGSYSLSGGGTVSVTGTGGVTLGTSGGNEPGVLNISGGSISATSITIWNTPGTSLSLSGGSLSVGTLNFNDTPSLFNWTGGTLNFTQATTINSSFVLGNSVALSSGMTLSSSSTLTNNGQLTLSGGALSATGPVVNQMGEISGNGTIGGSGGFTNSDEVAVSGGALVLSNTGANSNTGEIDLAAGNQLQLTGGALANTGTINLNGGTITGTAGLNNNSSGVISGNGTISAPLTSSGAITLASGTLNLPAVTNNGMIDPQGAAANVTGGAITNNSYIQGLGNIANAITNDGTIQPTGNSMLRLSGAVTNPAAGTITAGSGNDVILSQGLPTNAGLISLTGGTVDLTNVAMNNTGIISGYGVLRSGGLTNSSNITLGGGTATIDGSITNNASGTITVQAGTALFNSPVTNNGTFNAATGGNAVFVNGYSGGAITNNGAIALDANSISGDIQGIGTLAIGQTNSPVLERIAMDSGISTMSEPAIAAGSQFDLTNNDLIIHNGSLQQIQSLVDSGYNGGAENGSGIITSTGPAADRTLGVLLNNNGDNQPIYTTFDGQAVADTDVLVKYTLYGDANLDGSVNFADLLTVAQYYGQSNTDWAEGDFNDDGSTNFTDLLLLAQNYNQTLSASQNTEIDAISPSFAQAWTLAQADAVPEPLSLGLLAAVAGLAIPWRRR